MSHFFQFIHKHKTAIVGGPLLPLATTMIIIIIIIKSIKTLVHQFITLTCDVLSGCVGVTGGYIPAENGTSPFLGVSFDCFPDSSADVSCQLAKYLWHTRYDVDLTKFPRVISCVLELAYHCDVTSLFLGILKNAMPVFVL